MQELLAELNPIRDQTPSSCRSQWSGKAPGLVFKSWLGVYDERRFAKAPRPPNGGVDSNGEEILRHRRRSPAVNSSERSSASLVPSGSHPPEAGSGVSDCISSCPPPLASRAVRAHRRNSMPRKRSDFPGGAAVGDERTLQPWVALGPGIGQVPSARPSSSASRSASSVG